MTNIYTYFRHIAFVILTGFAFFVKGQNAAAQGCDQVDIKYEESPCFERKGAVGTPNGGSCTPVTVCVDQPYTYAALGGPWATYQWAITSGPATPSINPSPTVANISIVWPVTGTYVLTLTVTDASGNVFTKCLTVTVTPKPVAGFTFSPSGTPCAPSAYNFTNTTTFSGTAYYSWDFGDPASGANNTSNATHPSHVYNAAGTYTVTLIAYSSILVPSPPSSTGGTHADSLTLVTCCADTFQQKITLVNGNVKIECISTVCAGDTATYTAVGCSGAVWGTPVGGTAIASSGNTITVVWGNGNPQGQLSVTCGGCTAYATVPIVPTTTIITGNTSPCNTSSSVYTVPFLPGTDYTWTLTNVTASSPANFMLSTYPDNNSAVINWSLGNVGDTYLLTVNLNNKHLCCSSTGSLNIILKNTYSIFGPSSICKSTPPTPASFFPNLTGTFNWSVSNTSGVIPPGATGTGSYTATFANAGTYVITAQNTSGAFCNSSASTTLTVVQPPTPGTLVGPLVGCPGSQYAYSISTPAPTGYYYEWTITNGTFPPGTSTTGDNTTAIFTSLPGTIAIQLKQSTAPFCVVNVGIFTINMATMGLVTGDTSVCVDGIKSYTLTGGTVPPGTTINWSISIPSLGTINPPVNSNPVNILWHGTTSPGPWGPVTVNASSTCGNATGQANIMIYPKFIMNITMGSGDICTLPGVPLTANGAPAGATYSWTPNGQTTQSITTTTFGNHTVTATRGCTATANKFVPDPFAIVPVRCLTPRCSAANMAPLQLTVNVAKPASGTFTYTWHTGPCTSMGGVIATTTSTALSNSLNVTTDGFYSVEVTYGTCTKCVDFFVPKVCCPDVNNPTITQNQQLSCNTYQFTGVTPNPTGASIIWDFGDGTTATGASGVPITHTYGPPGQYCVQFCVGPPAPNPTGCTGNCIATQALVPIGAAFSYTLGCNGCLNVANESVNIGPGSVVYQWNYGDGSPIVTSPNPGPHCYTSGGTFPVTLTMTYTQGALTCTKTVTQNVTYTPLSINSSSPVCTGVPALFTSSPSGFVFYSWTFGDGFTAFSPSVSHAYVTATGYPVTLQVTDLLGNVCSAATNVTVLPGISSCTIQPAYICPGHNAVLTAASGSYTYLWEVETSPGVFSAAPGANTGATYATNVPGNYHVVITSTVNGCFCISNTVPVTPAPKPKATFGVSPSKQLCNPGGFVIMASPNIPGYTYDWYANGNYGSSIGSGSTIGQTVSLTTPIHLVVTNQYGCTDTCTQVITVNPVPAAPVISATSLCAGVPITLTVTNHTGNITWNNGANTLSIVVFSAGTYVATYTDPVTGCSASKAITINRRPSAGLFPHYCDSIPCKCTRPFTIYAPNPLIGLFATNYTVDWYDANTNTLLFTGSSYNNGGLGAQTGSYYIVITDQSTMCTDTSNEYSIVVPPCDTCKCEGSSWGEMFLTSGGATTAFPSCGTTIPVKCKVPYTFTANYNCVGPTCKGKVTYSLQPPTGPAISGTGAVTFTPTVFGTYTLTIYGWCGSKICDSCIIKFRSDCQPCDCKASKWDNIVLTQGVPSDGGKVIIGATQSLKCDKTYKLECNKPYNLSAGFICKDTACKGTVTYKLMSPSGGITTGSMPLNFTTSQNGTYVLTLYGWCGEKICDSCVIRFEVLCGCDCAGTKWNDILISQIGHPGGMGIPAAVVSTGLPVKCWKTYNVECSTAYSINTSYICKDTCKGKVTYSLLPPSGSAITGSVPANFTTTQNGTYTLTLYGWCGDKICDSCVISFKVDNCPPVDTPCCKYTIRVQPGTPTYTVTTAGSATIASQTFTISGLTGVLLSEVRAEVLSYNITSNFKDECLSCKTLPFIWASIASAANIGAVPGLISLYGGATTAFFNPTGGGVYQNPREVVWNNGSNFTITGPIGIKFYLPPPPLIDCCELKGQICVKFTFRDINCKECEVVTCFDVAIKK